MFWDTFSKLCASRGVKPNTVCREIGLSTATATHWKQGQLPKSDKLQKVADYFDVTTDYLLTGTTTTQNEEAHQLDADLQRIVEKYNRLSDEDKKKADSYIDFLDSIAK